MLLEELIEKAFSDGYEYALEEQREFASIRQTKKLYKAFRKGENAFQNLRRQGVERSAANQIISNTNPGRTLKRMVPDSIQNTENHLNRLVKNAPEGTKAKIIGKKELQRKEQLRSLYAPKR